jgi:hypothetical protein
VIPFDGGAESVDVSNFLFGVWVKETGKFTGAPVMRDLIAGTGGNIRGALMAMELEILMADSLPEDETEEMFADGSGMKIPSIGHPDQFDYVRAGVSCADGCNTAEYQIVNGEESEYVCSASFDCRVADLVKHNEDISFSTFPSDRELDGTQISGIGWRKLP